MERGADQLFFYLFIFCAAAVTSVVDDKKCCCESCWMIKLGLLTSVKKKHTQIRKRQQGLMLKCYCVDIYVYVGNKMEWKNNAMISLTMLLYSHILSWNC